MALTRKEISFDLDTKKLEKYFNNISNAYYNLRIELKKVGFEHRQGSVYNSILPMNHLQLVMALKDVCKKLPWLSDCAKSIDSTNIGKIHSLMDDVNQMCSEVNGYENKKAEQLEWYKKTHKSR